ncbi:hypothetical protein PSTG_13633 [Puccinia striiformis f. sp. tritici PST-78]|uniref:Uncharacterized protein n=1 Tax=Puccinia striiformis f. sp. tritici PST-78 TaxID=1165861 RepID=A0A0L0V138_9BASI|nr:hypothetical protein PSTG_13633 [Puccinia striiformis f. sp. tritici PST-78]
MPAHIKTMTCPGLGGHCLGKVSHHQCEDAAIRIDEHFRGFGLLRHKGCHNHPWPEAKKPDQIALAKFATTVENDPKAGAFKLKLGKQINKEGEAFESVTTLHQAFHNKDCVAYHRRRILVGMGLTPDKNGGGIGDKFILDMFGWSNKGLLVTSSSFMPGEEHFSFQTPWMAEPLVARDQNNKLYSGSFLLDVTFNQPISQNSLREFFKQFFRVTMTHAEQDAMACQVVDFSVAQTDGFVTVILGHEEEPFRKACMDLLELVTPDGPTHEQKIDVIYRQFPKKTAPMGSQTLLMVRHEPGVVFLLFSPLTPASSCVHHSDGKNCLLVGMVELFSFVYSLEEDWNAVMKGVAICYGSKPPKDIGQSMGLAPKRKRNHQAPSDGRPPDTSDALAEVPGKQSKLGRPRYSANFDKNQHSTYPLYRLITKISHQANRCWMAAGLEGLYALFSPLWLRGINSRGQDLFSFLVNHFNS